MPHAGKTVDKGENVEVQGGYVDAAQHTMSLNPQRELDLLHLWLPRPLLPRCGLLSASLVGWATHMASVRAIAAFFRRRTIGREEPARDLQGESL